MEFDFKSPTGTLQISVSAESHQVFPCLQKRRPDSVSGHFFYTPPPQKKKKRKEKKINELFQGWSGAILSFLANASIILWLITPNLALLRKSIDGVTGAIFGARGTRSNPIYAYVLCWQVRRRFRERKRQGVQEERQEKGFLLNDILTFRGNCFVIGY